MTKDIYEIIGKVLNQEANTEDQNMLKAWLNDSKQNRLEFELLKKTWDHTNVNYKAPYQEIVLKGILAEIDEKSERTVASNMAQREIPRIQDSNRSRRSIFMIARIAAGLIIMACFLFALRFFSNTAEEPQQSLNYVTKATEIGQKSKVYLPDGSIVWLNSQSKISYPAAFSDDSRIVRLTGQAFFEVAPDASKPFTVISGEVSTTAIGTSFDIRAFEEEDRINVSLATGKVKIDVKSSDKKQEIILLPNEGIVFNPEQNKVTKTIINPKENFSWKDGVIYFNEASLDEVIKTLSRWYGVNFTVLNKDDLPWSYTGEFDNAYLKDVLESISFTKDFDFSINNMKVTINFKSEN